MSSVTERPSSVACIVPSKKEAERFLTLLDEEAESYTIQTFDDVVLPNGKKRKDPHLTRVFHGTIEEYWGKLCLLNNQGAGIFFNVNETDGTGRKKENIIRVRVIFQEQDSPGCPELPIAPHIVVESSPGKHHRYILVDNCPLEAFQGLQNRMVLSYGSDPAAVDISRVLRLPGFFHRKNLDQPHMVRVVKESGEKPLSYEVVEKIFPPVVRQGKAPPPTKISIGSKQAAEIISAVNALSPDLPYNEWLSIGMCLHDGFAGGIYGLQIWDEWSSRGASYRSGECAYKWSSFHADNGVTIKTLFKIAAETGWRWAGEVNGTSENSSLKAPKKGRFALVRLHEIEIAPSDWLVHDFLTSDSLALFFSDPGSCKTFLAISLACSIATGTLFCGRKVKQATVVFIAGEGHSGLKKRFMAWSIHYQVSLDRAPIFISTVPAALLSAESVVDVSTAIDQIAAEHGTPGLIVFDTVARNFGVGDENATKDMGIFVQAADRIRDKYKATVLLIHHTGHGDKTRARGAMALKGALDFEYRLIRGSDDVVRVDPTKVKDFEPPPPMAFRLCPVKLPLLDDEGKPITSAVLDSTNYEPPPKPYKIGGGKNQTRALEALKNLIERHKVNLERDGCDKESARVTIEDWKAVCQSEAGLDRKRFYEVSKSLSEQGAVEIVHGIVRLLY